MKIKILICSLLVAFGFLSCSKEYDCDDLQISPAFINFPPSDIDTIILRKYRQNDSYQTLIDTFKVINGYSGQYYTSNDTTTVFVSNGKNGIKAGFDWLIFIPAKNKTIFISEIMSEKKTGTCGSGIFSMDKFGCTCTNDIFSVKKDNQIIYFSNPNTARDFIFIQN
jgi:hypothetical protein